MLILGRSYRLTGDHARAIGVFTKHLKSHPHSLVSHVELVVTYGERGDLAKAREAANEVLRIRPTFSIKRWARSQTYKDRAIVKREIDALRKAGLPE